MTQLPENLPHVIQIAAPFVSKYGYFGVAGLLLLESSGVPIPGETTLVASAVFAGIGQLNILAVIIIAIIAAVIGDNIAYAIGYFGGRKVIKGYGKYFFIPPERYKRLEDFFTHKGGRVVVFARFIDGLRQLNGFIAGSSDMKWPTFLVFNLVGAVLWVLTWSIFGYLGGSHIAVLLSYQIYVSLTFVVLLAGFIVWKLLKTNKPKT